MCKLDKLCFRNSFGSSGSRLIRTAYANLENCLLIIKTCNSKGEWRKCIYGCLRQRKELKTNAPFCFGLLRDSFIHGNIFAFAVFFEVCFVGFFCSAQDSLVSWCDWRPRSSTLLCDGDVPVCGGLWWGNNCGRTREFSSCMSASGIW